MTAAIILLLLDDARYQTQAAPPVGWREWRPIVCMLSWWLLFLVVIEIWATWPIMYPSVWEMLW